jgi:hypothetical protein
MNRFSHVVIEKMSLILITPSGFKLLLSLIFLYEFDYSSYSKY